MKIRKHSHRWTCVIASIGALKAESQKARLDAQRKQDEEKVDADRRNEWRVFQPAADAPVTTTGTAMKRAISILSFRRVHHSRARGGKKLRYILSGGELGWLKLPGVELTDSKEGKPFGMQTHISRRPNLGDSNDIMGLSE